MRFFASVLQFLIQIVLVFIPLVFFSSSELYDANAILDHFVNSGNSTMNLIEMLII